MFARACVCACVCHMCAAGIQTRLIHLSLCYIFSLAADTKTQHAQKKGPANRLVYRLGNKRCGEAKPFSVPVVEKVLEIGRKVVNVCF